MWWKKKSSPPGGPILRHEAQAPPEPDVAHADDERLSAHLARCLGQKETVFHELVSDPVHIDVHIVPPGDGHPYHVLMTSGMSALPMNVPATLDDRDAWTHAELCMVLPAAWELDQAALDDERHYWPIRLLKSMARLPH